MPTGAWFGAEAGLSWGPSAEANINRQALWSSPIFDLRPDLGGLSPNEGNTLTTGAQRIWRMGGLGQGSRLFVSIGGMSGTDIDGLELGYVEQAHPTRLTQIQDTQAEQLVTQALDSSRLRSTLIFIPPGDEWPIRYYRLRLIFKVRANAGGIANPILSVQGAMY
mgnify:CR=1 FL=1|jgi:hypothetical protein